MRMARPRYDGQTRLIFDCCTSNGASHNCLPVAPQIDEAQLEGNIFFVNGESGTRRTGDLILEHLCFFRLVLWHGHADGCADVCGVAYGIFATIDHEEVSADIFFEFHGCGYVVGVVEEDYV